MDLYTQVFTDSEGGDEGKAIGALVAEIIQTTNASDYFGCLAYVEDVLAGSIFFTRMEIDNHTEALLLSPVAVQTEYQKQGLGSKLIQFGLDIATKRFIDVIFTYGDPRYYKKFGFEFVSEDDVKAPCILSYPKGWLMRVNQHCEVAFSGNQARCVVAFDQAKYW